MPIPRRERRDVRGDMESRANLVPPKDIKTVATTTGKIGGVVKRGSRNDKSQQVDLPSSQESPPGASLSLFQLHVREWENCTRCPLCETRRNIVLSRGKVPCDVLFIGEGPGESEDVLGAPFVGPAGHLLDHIIERSVPQDKTFCAECGEDVTKLVNDEQGRVKYTGCPKCPRRPRAVRVKMGMRIALTNLVACIPRDAEGNKSGEPDPDEIVQCSPRLESFVELAAPRLIVCVGALSEAWIMGSNRGQKGKRHLLASFEGPIIAIKHPAAILRSNVAAQGLDVQRCIVGIRTAIDDLVRHK